MVTALNDFAPDCAWGRGIDSGTGGINNEGTAGTGEALAEAEDDAIVLPCERGRRTLLALPLLALPPPNLRNGDGRTPAGNAATGRCSWPRTKVPDARDRPLGSTDGRGPRLTLGV